MALQKTAADSSEVSEDDHVGRGGPSESVVVFLIVFKAGLKKKPPKATL